VVERSPNKLDTLNSNPNITKERKEEREGGRKAGKKGGREEGRDRGRRDKYFTPTNVISERCNPKGN
jgi:hypothetical protein